MFNKRNVEQFEKLVDEILWDDVYIYDDAEQAYQSFLKSFNSVFNMCFPLVSKQANKANAFRKPWFTTGLHKSLKAKNKLYKKYIGNPSPTNVTNYKKKYCNKYNNLIRIAKKRYYSEKFNDASNNLKTTWGVINQLLNRKKIFCHSSIAIC